MTLQGAPDPGSMSSSRDGGSSPVLEMTICAAAAGFGSLEAAERRGGSRAGHARLIVAHDHVHGVSVGGRLAAGRPASCAAHVGSWLEARQDT